jgi:hypothetical protein
MAVQGLSSPVSRSSVAARAAARRRRAHPLASAMSRWTTAGLRLPLVAKTAIRVARGDYSARVPRLPLADDELRALAVTLNALLDRVASDRERLREFSTALIGAGDRARARGVGTGGGSPAGSHAVPARAG